MKTSFKILAALSCVIAALTSCKEEVQPFVAELSLNQSTIALDKAGEDITFANVVFEVESNTYWRAFLEEGCTWLTLSKMGAGAGKTLVSVGAEANIALEPRTTSVTFETLDGTSATITFTQDFIDASILDLNSPAFYGKPGKDKVYPNCFMLSEPGKYRFSPYMPDGSKCAGTNATWVWVQGNEWTSVPAENPAEGILDWTFEDGSFTLEVPQDFKPGNVLLAITDQSGVIEYSWHVWVTVEPKVIEMGGVYWMDRNIGAAHQFDSSDDDIANSSRGFYYQWGCKNPITGSYNSTSKTSFIEGESAAYTAYNTQVSNVEGWTVMASAPAGWAATLSDPIPYPMSYMGSESIIPLATTSDSWPVSTSPCPYGYHIMTMNEAKVLGANTLTKTSKAGTSTENVASVFNTTGLNFPSNGYRNPTTAAIAYASNPDGRYWTSDVYSSTRKSYWLMNASNNKTNNAQGSCGMSVRCVRD